MSGSASRRPAINPRSLAATRRNQTVAASLLAFGATWALVASHPAASTAGNGASAGAAAPRDQSTTAETQPTQTPASRFFTNPGANSGSAPTLRSTNRRGVARSGGS
jgi:hypothetical protein